jgi:hypothetical protein
MQKTSVSRGSAFKERDSDRQPDGRRSETDSYFEYFRTVLVKVSFDQALFMKEYRKAINYLTTREVDDLNVWLFSRGIHTGVHHESLPNTLSTEKVSGGFDRP